MAGQNIYADHDFGNNHSRYFLQIWQYETLSVTIGNRLPTWKFCWVFSLKLYIIFLSRFAVVNSRCYFCLYEGKATYLHKCCFLYTSFLAYQRSLIECFCYFISFLLFHFFKWQTWAQTFYFFNHSESIGCVRKCMCLSIFFMSS